MSYQTKIIRNRMVEYAEFLKGTPYVWGGDDPMAGFDCSGLIIELLMSEGLFSGDTSAEGLRQTFEELDDQHPIRGDLLFWTNEEGRAYHVAMSTGGERYIEAGGGASETETIQDAIEENAFVRPRTFDWRGEPDVVCNPLERR